VRRKPYSVILLDEVEKAHPDVHEIFFQVFDKGIMEDGNGRRIDFKNTLIILTTNVGTDLIMELSRDPRYRTIRTNSPRGCGRRCSTYSRQRCSAHRDHPLFPVVECHARRHRPIAARPHRSAHSRQPSRSFVYDDAVVEHIVSKCNDPDSGGRMIDNIITNTLLPALSREFLKRSLAKETSRRRALASNTMIFRTCGLDRGSEATSEPLQ